MVRLYGLRLWVEQGDKQVKRELGWADFQVRADRAVRRHRTLVCCAFSFCWRAWFAAPPPAAARERTRATSRRSRRLPVLAADVAPGARLAGSVELPGALLARVVERAPASGCRHPTPSP